jgi:hypothetical protein
MELDPWRTLMKKKDPSEKAKPVFSKRCGKVSVAVWENETREGAKFFRTSFRCQYRESESGEWRDAAYSAFDLLDLTRCIADAQAFIRMQEQPPTSAEAA